MSERRDVEYIGQYRCSARAKETLRRGEAYVDSAMVDWSLFAEFSDEFSLDVERDNKSVWDPRWLVRGLARFGSSVPASLATKFRRPEPLREARTSRGASNQKESPRGASSASPRTVGSASRHQRGRSDFDFTFLNGGRAVLSDRRTRNFGGSGTPGFDPAVYERAKAATFRMAGGRSRRHVPLHENEVVDKVLHLNKSAGAPFFANTSLVLDRGIQRSRDVRAGRIGFDPYVAYRRIQHGSSGPKGRLVWGSPLATTILAASFAKAAYKGLIRRHCFSYGYQKAEVGAFISEFQAVTKRVYCLDFSGFDSSVPAFIIGDAFEIVRTHLEMDDEETDLFYRLTNDFIHSRIVLPDASIYQKHRGIPSGSPFTSIVGSICNLLILKSNRYSSSSWRAWHGGKCFQEQSRCSRRPGGVSGSRVGEFTPT
nr:MAG: RNA-dependent RNA polymerase [Partitiviridae sp.]